jgi:hypothetical protein
MAIALGQNMTAIAIGVRINFMSAKPKGSMMVELLDLP